MKIAVLSDIHGNFEAMRQVLADADRLGVDRMLCLGDCIGYGPEPEQVLVEMRRRAIPSIIGNHEMAVLDRVHLNWFNPMARASLEQTLTMLSMDSIDFIKSLPYYISSFGCWAVHGFPPDSAQTYLFQKAAPELRQAFKALAEPMCFIGHTHNLEIVHFDGRQVERRPLSEGITLLEPDHGYMINVGSVGQPRDGTNHAKYIVWDQDQSRIETRFVPYDIAATVAKIEAAGLPLAHAQRLW